MNQDSSLAELTERIEGYASEPPAIIHNDPRKLGNWRPIPGFPDYIASDAGWIAKTFKEVRGHKRILEGARQKSGHLIVNLRDANNKAHRIYVHRLILTTFKGEPEPGMYGCHYDDDPTNNALSNLRWGTAKDNGADVRRNNRSRKALTITHQRALERITQLETERATLIREIETLKGQKTES